MNSNATPQQKRSPCCTDKKRLMLLARAEWGFLELQHSSTQAPGSLFPPSCLAHDHCSSSMDRTITNIPSKGPTWVVTVQLSLLLWNLHCDLKTMLPPFSWRQLNSALHLPAGCLLMPDSCTVCALHTSCQCLQPACTDNSRAPVLAQALHTFGGSCLSRTDVGSSALILDCWVHYFRLMNEWKQV